VFELVQNRIIKYLMLQVVIIFSRTCVFKFYLYFFLKSLLAPKRNRIFKLINYVVDSLEVMNQTSVAGLLTMFNPRPRVGHTSVDLTSMYHLFSQKLCFSSLNRPTISEKQLTQIYRGRRTPNEIVVSFPIDFLFFKYSTAAL
jgi:hypothetical protein